MPLTEEQTKQLLVDELYRDEDPAFGVTVFVTEVTFKSLVNNWWVLYEDKFAVHARLGYLYVKRQALRYLREQVWTNTTHRAFDRYQYDSDLTKALGKMIEEVNIELNTLEGNKQGGRDGLFWTGTTISGVQTVTAEGGISTISPIQGGVAAGELAALGADPNGAGYRGSPTTIS